LAEIRQIIGNAIKINDIKIRNMVIKQIFAQIILLTVTLLCVSATVMADTYQVTGTTLNVRSGAGSSYGKIGALKQNETVEVLEISRDWAKINYNGKNGYVSTDYLSKVIVEEQTDVKSDLKDMEWYEPLFRILFTIVSIAFPIVFFILLFTKVDDSSMRWKFVFIYYLFPPLLIIPAGIMLSGVIWLIIMALPFLGLMGLYGSNIRKCYDWTKYEYSTGTAFCAVLIPSLILSILPIGAIIKIIAYFAEWTWVVDETFSIGVLVLAAFTIVSLVAPKFLSKYELTIRFATVYLVSILALMYMVSGSDLPSPFGSSGKIFGKEFFQTLLIALVVAGCLVGIVNHIIQCFFYVKDNHNTFLAIITLAFPVIVIGIVAFIITLWMFVMLIPVAIIFAMATGSSSGSGGETKEEGEIIYGPDGSQIHNSGSILWDSKGNRLEEGTGGIWKSSDGKHYRKESAGEGSSRFTEVNY
jgi:hypothetical protein